MAQSPSQLPDSARFDVAILDFDARPEAPDSRLMRVFGIDAASARALLSSLPATVCQQVNRVRADHFVRALKSIGARVELRDEHGARVSSVDDVSARSDGGNPGGSREPSEPWAAAPAHAVANVPSKVPALVRPKAATMFLGSDSYAKTLEAVPAPVIEPIRLSPGPPGPRDASLQPSAAKSAPSPEMLQLAPTAPRISADVGSAWGELQRQPGRARPPSQSFRAASDADPWQEPAALPPAGASQSSPAAMSLGPAAAGPGPRLHALDASGPMLSLEPGAPPGVSAPERAVAMQAQLIAKANPPPSAAAVPGAQVAPRARLPAPQRAITPAPPLHYDASFWEALPEAMAFPWLGKGWLWVIGIAIWAACANLLTALAQVAPIAGWIVMIFANSSVLAICADYHRRCMWAIVNGEDALDEGPDFDPARILHGYMRAGSNLLAFALLSQVPVALWLLSAVGGGAMSGLDVVFSARLWVLAALPALYWPMAVATASLYNRYSGVWFVPVGVRAIARAPLEYAAIVTAGALMFLVPSLIFAIIVRVAGLPSLSVLALAGLPMAASHGLMGTLTGELMRAKSELFD